DRPSDSLNDLAERTATHQSSVSVVVRRLVERGLVVRTPSAADKRRIEIDVTPAGRALLAEAPITIQQQLIEGLGTLPIDRQVQLADTFEQWLHASGVDLAAPPVIGEEGGDSASGAC